MSQASDYYQILGVTKNATNFSRPSLFRCDPDGRACTHYDISAAQGNGSADEVWSALDVVNRKLYVVTSNFANGNRPGLFLVTLL